MPRHHALHGAYLGTGIQYLDTAVSGMNVLEDVLCDSDYCVTVTQQRAGSGKNKKMRFLKYIYMIPKCNCKPRKLQ
jgi:hypothetical protein